MRSPFGPVSDVRKIAVLRANGIGDLIFALPALEALRAAYPRAEIVLLASDWHREFLSGRPGPVDRVVPVPPSRGVREDTGRPEDPDELDRFFERMREEEFDVAFQMHGGGRHSNPFVRRLGAHLTVGLKTADAAPLDRWLPYIYFQSEVLRYLEVVSLAGAEVTTVEPRIVVTRSDVAESRRVVPDARPFAVLHPSASDPKRRWPAASFARVARALNGAGLDVFVIGIERDRDIARAVTVGAGLNERADLTQKLSLQGLAGLLSRASVVVSNDSGPLHVATAAGVPTVGIYWCGNVITAAPVMRRRHRPILSWRLTCPRCGANAIDAPCGHLDSYVADVPVQEVTRAAFDLLEEEENTVDADERPEAEATEEEERREAVADTRQ